MLTLIVQEKGGSPTRMEFERDEVTVGRVPGNDIVLAKGNVSKRHSRVVRQDGRFFVVDLKSTNGTYLNGRRITTPSVIRPGDKIYIGDFVVMVDMGAENVVEEAPDALDDAQTGAGMVSPFANQPGFSPPASDPPSEEAIAIAEVDDSPDSTQLPPTAGAFGGPPPLTPPSPLSAPAPLGPGRPPALTAQGPGSPLSPRNTAPLGGPSRPPAVVPSSAPSPLGAPGPLGGAGPSGNAPPPSYAAAPAGSGGPSAAMRATAAGLGPARAPLGAPLGSAPGLRPGGASGTREGNAPPPLTPSIRPSGPAPLDAMRTTPEPSAAPPPLSSGPSAPPSVGSPQSVQATIPPGALQAVAMPVITPSATPYNPSPVGHFDTPNNASDAGREVIPVMPEPVNPLDAMRAVTPVPSAPAPRAFEPAPSAPLSAPLSAPVSMPQPMTPLAPLSTSLPPSVASPVVTAAFSAVTAPSVPPARVGPRLSPAPAPVSEPAPGGEEYRELLAQVVSSARSQGVEPTERLLDDAGRARMRSSVEGAARGMSALPAGVTHDRLTRDALAEIAGYGALETALEDPEVTSVVVEPGGRVLVGRSGPLSPSGQWFSSAESLKSAVSRWLRSEGVEPDGSPVVDVTGRDGTRLLAVSPPLSSTGLTVTLDRAAQRVLSLADLVGRGMPSQPAAALLSLAVTSRRNVVVCGPAGSGRSTLLGALLGAVAPQERVVVIESRSELARGRRGAVGLSSQNDGARAVALAQRMRPHRLVMSDVSEGVARGALVALSTGHEGWMFSLEAPSAMVGLSRLATMGALGPWFSPEDGTERIANTRPLVVEVARLGDGQCRVTSVGEARALEGALFIDLLFNLRVDRSDGADGISAQLVPTGASASFAS